MNDREANELLTVKIDSPIRVSTVCPSVHSAPIKTFSPPARYCLQTTGNNHGVRVARLTKIICKAIKFR